MAAVANSVYHAIGKRINELPLSPGAIMDAIEGNGNTTST
jgi:CO/xanthine dehydrogenase Mo-binding subunit